MLNTLTLAAVNFAAWGIIDWIKLIIIVAACVGIMYVALNYFGVTIPGWAVKIFWIVIVCIVALVAINIIAGLF
jgi:hypothetical protein